MRVIIEDSRNKPDKNAHIREQLESLGYKVERSKMYVGDYQFADSGKIVVDTKQDLQEVVGNVTQQHDRFIRECDRAHEAGIKLVILIQDPKICDLSGVFSWYNIRLRYNKKATTGQILGKILYSIRDKHNVRFEFAKKDELGKRIIELLEDKNENLQSQS